MKRKEWAQEHQSTQPPAEQWAVAVPRIGVDKSSRWATHGDFNQRRHPGLMRYHVTRMTLLSSLVKTLRTLSPIIVVTIIKDSIELSSSD